MRVLESSEVAAVSGAAYEGINWFVRTDHGADIFFDGPQALYDDDEIVITGNPDPFAWAIADWVQRNSALVLGAVGQNWGGTLGGLVGAIVGDTVAQTLGDITFSVMHNEDSVWKDLYNARHGSEPPNPYEQEP